MLNRLGQCLGWAGVALFALSVPAMADETSELEVAEDDEHGEYLVTDEGRSVYMFEADSTDTSACYDDCADAWPPLEADNGMPTAGDGVDEDLIGTTERDDGTEQVTYDGQPLYLFVRDTEMGDTSGHDIEGFGDEWYLVSPDGGKAGADHSEAVGADPQSEGRDATETDANGTDSETDTTGTDDANGTDSDADTTGTDDTDTDGSDGDANGSDNGTDGTDSNGSS